MEPRHLVILAYHKIGPPAPGGWETWYYVPEQTFADQLDCLRQLGWSVIDVAAFLTGLSDPDSLPPRAALVTFDDGYRNNHDYALPRLRERGCPGVVFVPTQYVGGINGFDADTREPPEPICSWEHLRELERGGVSVQSHGVSHRTFSDLSPAELDEELKRSKAALEDGLGKVVELLAYPYGDGGSDPPRVADALRRGGYRAAFLYEGGPIRLPAADPFRLERLPMWPDTDLRAALAVVP